MLTLERLEAVRSRRPVRAALLFTTLAIAACRTGSGEGGSMVSAHSAANSAVPSAAASSPPTNQAGRMEREQQFIASLRAVSTTVQEEALAKDELASARAIPRLATSLWAKADPELSANALAFLSEIGDLAIVPVLEAPLRDDPQAAVQALNLLAEAELSLRQRVIERVDQLLDDKRPIPPRPQIGPKPDEPNHPRRVCDEAYVAMRRLVHFGESQYGSVVEVSFFYAAPEVSRDKAIAEARRSHDWRRAVNPADDDAEPEGSPGPLGPLRR